MATWRSLATRMSSGGHHWTGRTLVPLARRPSRRRRVSSNTNDCITSSSRTAVPHARSFSTICVRWGCMRGRTRARSPTSVACVRRRSVSRRTWGPTSGHIRARNRTNVCNATSRSIDPTSSSYTRGYTRARSPTIVACARSRSASRARWSCMRGRTRARSPTVAACARRRSATKAILGSISRFTSLEWNEIIKFQNVHLIFSLFLFCFAFSIWITTLNINK